MKAVPKIIIQIEPSRSSGRGLLRGISSYANIHGPWMFYRQPHSYLQTAATVHLPAFFKDIEADGMIGFVANQDIADRILSRKIPAVLIPTVQPLSRAAYTVMDDSPAIGVMGARYLLNKGLKKFAYCGFGTLLGSDEIGKAFTDSLKQAGFHTYSYQPPKTKKQRLWKYELLLICQWLQSLPKPIGMMTCNDDRSQNIIEACELVGIKVPDEVAILGVDNDDIICNLAVKPLSSVALNFERVGYRAAELLHRLVRGETVEPQILRVEPTHVVTRQSTDIEAISEPDVAEAVRFIRRRAKQPVQVNEVADAVAMSRRALYDKFMKTLGHSVNEEIQNARLEQIIHLLINTDMPISQIASALGFPSGDHIARYFKRKKQMTLQAFRKHYNGGT